LLGNRPEPWGAEKLTVGCGLPKPQPRADDYARGTERLFASTDADDCKPLHLLDGHYGHAIVAQTDTLSRLHLQILLT
jgi:hypothetical protein